jgi:transcriptional regulator with XRE-family HTH domain
VPTKPVELPGQLRMRLGLRLSEARKARGLTQLAAAQAAHVSQPTISAIEKAAVEHIKPAVIDALVALYEIDEAEAEELRLWARSPYGSTRSHADTTTGPAWWQQHEDVEHQAVTIQAFHLQAFDGLLQCEPYMRLQFELSGTPNVEASVERRLLRQAAMMSRPNPPHCTFILDAACFYKTMGSRDVLAEQVRQVLTLTERPFLTVLVLPVDALSPASTYGFTLLRFSSKVIGDFVSVEYEVGSATLEDPTTVQLYMGRWKDLVQAALSEADSRHFMVDRLGQLID